MSQTRSQTEAEVLALRLDVLRARAHELAAEFNDLAFTQVADLLAVARATMLNYHPADRVSQAGFVDRARQLEGEGRSLLQRFDGGN